MFATALTRPFAALSLFSAPRTKPRRGAMPRWTDDPQLAEKLLHDTGLSPEDLGAAPRQDPKLPFFMQTPSW